MRVGRARPAPDRRPSPSSGAPPEPTIASSASPTGVGPTRMWRWATIIAVSVVSAEWMSRVVDSWRRGMSTTDTLWYHLPMAARFVQDGWTTRLHFVDARSLIVFYPETSELLHATLMLFLGNDVLSLVVNLGWLSLALLSAWCIGRRFGVPHLTLIGAVVVLATPQVVLDDAGSGLTDIVGLALFLAAVALVSNAAREGVGPAGASAEMLCGALAAGLAAGTKYTLVIPVVLLTLGVIVLTPRPRTHSIHNAMARRGRSGWRLLVHPELHRRRQSDTECAPRGRTASPSDYPIPGDFVGRAFPFSTRCVEHVSSAGPARRFRARLVERRGRRRIRVRSRPRGVRRSDCEDLGLHRARLLRRLRRHPANRRGPSPDQFPAQCSLRDSRAGDGHRRPSNCPAALAPYRICACGCVSDRSRRNPIRGHDLAPRAERIRALGRGGDARGDRDLLRHLGRRVRRAVECRGASPVAIVRTSCSFRDVCDRGGRRPRCRGSERRAIHAQPSIPPHPAHGVDLPMGTGCPQCSYRDRRRLVAIPALRQGPVEPCAVSRRETRQRRVGTDPGLPIVASSGQQRAISIRRRGDAGIPVPRTRRRRSRRHGHARIPRRTSCSPIRLPERTRGCSRFGARWTPMGARVAARP